MARCTCTNPCTCYFEYDGDRPGTVYPQPFQYGRYNTRKRGTGTAADPYIIEFMDSEEFQVEATQASTTPGITQTIASSTSVFEFKNDFTVVNYETPYEIFVAFAVHTQFNDGQMFPSNHRFWLVSAQATFVHNGSTNGARAIGIRWGPPADNYGNIGTPAQPGSIFIAGSSSTGLSEDVTLSCSGLAPFADFAERKDHYGPGGTFLIQLTQSSGSNMSVRDAQLTIVAI